MSSNLHTALFDANKLAEKIETALIENDGEVTPELEDLLDFKNYQQKDLEASIDAVIMTIDRIDHVMEYYERQMNTLKRIDASLEKARERFVSNIRGAMEAHNLDEIRGLYRSAKFKRNPPSVEILDESLVSEQFKELEIKEKINKKKIKEALDSGEELPWARMIQTRSIRFTNAKIALGETNGN